MERLKYNIWKSSINKNQWNQSRKDQAQSDANAASSSDTTHTNAAMKSLTGTGPVALSCTSNRSKWLSIMTKDPKLSSKTPINSEDIKTNPAVPMKNNPKKTPKLKLSKQQNQMNKSSLKKNKLPKTIQSKMSKKSQSQNSKAAVHRLLPVHPRVRAVLHQILTLTLNQTPPLKRNENYESVIFFKSTNVCCLVLCLIFWNYTKLKIKASFLSAHSSENMSLL